MARTQRMKLQTVLIIDADVDRREKLMKAMLGEAFKMRAVGTSKEAVLALKRQEHDLVVVSDANAKALLKETAPAVPEARFLVLTDVENLDVVMELQSLGAQEVLSRKLPTAQLAERMRRLMPKMSPTDITPRPPEKPAKK